MEHQTILDDLIEDPEGVRVRKLQSVLSLSGSAIIVFCVWSFVRIVARILFDDDSLIQASLESLEIDPMMARLVVILILVPFLGLDLWLRYYVGHSAVLESRGKLANEKRKKRYFFLAKVMAVLGVISLLSYLFPGEHGITVDDGISMIVELSSVIISFRLIWAAANLRKIEEQKKLRGTESDTEKG